MAKVSPIMVASIALASQGCRDSTEEQMKICQIEIRERIYTICQQTTLKDTGGIELVFNSKEIGEGAIHISTMQGGKGGEETRYYFYDGKYGIRDIRDYTSDGRPDEIRDEDDKEIKGAESLAVGLMCQALNDAHLASGEPR